MYKLKSVKLWLTVALIIGMGVLNHVGTITSNDFVEFVKWALVVFIGGNVSTKFAGKQGGQ